MHADDEAMALFLAQQNAVHARQRAAATSTRMPS
jgi:hypothetical protein